VDEQSRAVNRPSEGRVRYYYPTSEDLHVTLGEPLRSIREALVSADWFQDHDAVQPGELLSCAAGEDKLGRPTGGASFAVDTEGLLSRRLSLDLEEVGKSLQEERISWTAATR
jgi:hypothetical protein